MRSIFKNIFLAAFVFCFASCFALAQPREISPNDEFEKPLKVEVTISLQDSVVNFGDKISLTLKLTNNSNEAQKLLFDKPYVSTGGPWNTSGRVTDIHTKKSVVEYEEKSFISSHAFSLEELIDKYYTLQPGESIAGQYELTDIVVFKSTDYQLPKGEYWVQLFHSANASNVVPIKVQ